MAYFLGIDVSTTATKALLIDDSGAVASTHSVAYGLSTPHALWSEQNPSDWWTAAVESIRGALVAASVAGDAVKAIGLTGQMHGLVLLDDRGEVLRPAILWNDQRAGDQCSEIRELHWQGTSYSRHGQ